MEEDKWDDLKEAARTAGYQVMDTGASVQLRRNGEINTFHRTDKGRITGYQQACIFLSQQGIRPRKD